MPSDRITKAVDAVEAGYEFLLAYAAQGATGEAAARSDGHLREQLTTMLAAIGDLSAGYRAVLAGVETTERRDAYAAMVGVLEHDADAAQVAIRFVLTQRTISSQLIDNLNASTHVRAFLTDMFLIDEVLGR